MVSSTIFSAEFKDEVDFFWKIFLIWLWALFCIMLILCPESNEEYFSEKNRPHLWIQHWKLCQRPSFRHFLFFKFFYPGKLCKKACWVCIASRLLIIQVHATFYTCFNSSLQEELYGMQVGSFWHEIDHIQARNREKGHFRNCEIFGWWIDLPQQAIFAGSELFGVTLFDS